QAARHVAEHRRCERAPIAAMHEQRERSRAGAVWEEEVDGLPRGLPVGHAERATFLGGSLGPVLRGFAVPTCEDVDVLGNARAVVVLGLEVHSPLPTNRGTLVEGCPAGKRICGAVVSLSAQS